MRWRRSHRIITGGQLGEATARLAAALATAEPGSPAPRVVVWDERDVDDRWSDHDGAFVVRSRPVRTWLTEHGRPELGARAGDVELRAELLRYRGADTALVGANALRAAPWLRSHRARRAWLPTVDDLPALDAGLEVPPVEAGGPHAIVTTDAALRRHARLRDDPRHRWDPGLLPARRTGRPAAPALLAIGAPDRDHGIDLVTWTLARCAAELRERGAEVRWLAPASTAPSGEDLDELARAGVGDLLTVEPHRDPLAAALAEVAAPVAAVVLCGRPGADRPADLLVEAYRHGVAVLAFHDGPPADLALDDRWTVRPFGDVVALAADLVQELDRPLRDRLPDRVGLAGLFAAEDGRG